MKFKIEIIVDAPEVDNSSFIESEMMTVFEMNEDIELITMKIIRLKDENERQDPHS